MKIKQITSFLITFSLILAFTFTSYASSENKPISDDLHHICHLETFDDYEFVEEEEFREEFLNNPFIQEMYEESPSEVLEMAAVAYKNYSQLCYAGYYDDGNEYAVVPTTSYQQPNYYSCGPSSAYLAIYGWNGTSSIPGSTANLKVSRLATEMNTTTSGTMAYKVYQSLNNYAPSSAYKQYRYTTISNESTFRVYCFSSLADDRAPILLAKTENISYYEGHASGHYIEMYGLYYNNMTCRLNDTNNNNQYYGYKSVSISDAYAGVASVGGLIHWW